MSERYLPYDSTYNNQVRTTKYNNWAEQNERYFNPYSRTERFYEHSGKAPEENALHKTYYRRLLEVNHMYLSKEMKRYSLADLRDCVINYSIPHEDPRDLTNRELQLLINDIEEKMIQLELQIAPDEETTELFNELFVPEQNDDSHDELFDQLFGG